MKSIIYHSFMASMLVVNVAMLFFEAPWWSRTISFVSMGLFILNYAIRWRMAVLKRRVWFETWIIETNGAATEEEIRMAREAVIEEVIRLRPAFISIDGMEPVPLGVFLQRVRPRSTDKVSWQQEGF